MSAPVDYPVALALQDFMPVVLTGVGAACLIRPVARAAPRATATAATGTGLILAGGLSKAIWKLVVSLGGPDAQPMNKALFPLLSAGFLLLAHALLSLPSPVASPRGTDRVPPLWGFAATWALLGAVSLFLASSLPVMVLTVAAVTVCGVRLILLARAAGDTPAASAAGLWLLGMYVLGPLAARPDQSVALQWAEQSCNTLTQTALLLAALRTARSLTRSAPHPAGLSRTVLP
ncbi:hypothetical protein [Streptomyces sp. NBC_00358]|uniref:hypothetical protein n=1 Tax=Streptomyces sp. NBC_00358 TaxID=2975725 RepID=UPI002E26FA9D